MASLFSFDIVSDYDRGEMNNVGCPIAGLSAKRIFSIPSTMRDDFALTVYPRRFKNEMLLSAV